MESGSFHHRARHSSVVVGNYLWIHGGEVTTWNGTGNGFGSDESQGHVTTRPSNSTYSIDLSGSWTNGTVIPTTIYSKAPTLILQALWVDASGTSFYAFDGGLSFSIKVDDQSATPPNQLWQFTPSGNSGNWSQINPPASSNFITLVRGVRGTYASGDGLGFALGGHQSKGTSTGLKGFVPVPGMVMYNTTSQEWYNVSASGYSNSGVSLDGAAHFVPSFGPAGLLFVFGGTVSNSVLPGTDSVSIFDPMSQQWSFQKVSGTKPSPVVSPCVVGVQGDDQTYEIFLYGGRATDMNDTVAQGAVYVLSLPAFNWQKQKVTPQFGRYLHSCNVIGNRQMISVGGKVANASESEAALDDNDTPPDSSLPDPWQQGLGVFDLTAMEWKERYDADAPPYITPDPVKAFYQQNGKYPASWTNSLVRDWFEKNETNSNSHSPPRTGSSNRTRGIVGGLVGGIAASAALFIFVFFLLRHRRHRKAQPPTSEPNNHNENKPTTKNLPSEMQSSNNPSEMPQKENATSELPSHTPVELSSNPVSECRDVRGSWSISS